MLSISESNIAGSVVQFRIDENHIQADNSLGKNSRISDGPAQSKIPAGKTRGMREDTWDAPRFATDGLF